MSNPVKKERLEVPIWHKPYLTIDEATAYTGIGREKLREMTRFAVMKQRIEAARGDVIELKITNENTQLIPETGVRLETSRHVWLLFAISIIMILFFRRRRKIR